MCLSLAGRTGVGSVAHPSVTAKGSAGECRGMRDASLDDFLSGSDETAEEDTPASEDEAEAVEEESEPDPESESEPEPERESDPEPVSGPEPDGPPPIAEVDPARSTFAWSPDGAACAECGASVEERWEAEGGLVCVECKEW